jgi:hypothetical protein
MIRVDQVRLIIKNADKRVADRGHRIGTQEAPARNFINAVRKICRGSLQRPTGQTVCDGSWVARLLRQEMTALSY